MYQLPKCLYLQINNGRCSGFFQFCDLPKTYFDLIGDSFVQDHYKCSCKTRTGKGSKLCNFVT